MEIIDPQNVQEVFADGVHEVRIIEGMARAVFYSRQNGIGIVAVRLRIPVAVLPDVIQALVIALAEAARAIRPTS